MSRTESPETVDVLVVGARCAGASTAMLAARAGMSVLVVDRADPGTDTLSTHALMRPGVLALSRWGLLDEVRAAGTPRVSEVVYHYGDDTVSIPIRPRGDVDGLYAPRRNIIDPILVRAAERAGAEIRHRVSFRRVVRDAFGRVIGAVLQGAAGEYEVRCRVLIGADGARSRVARAVAAPVVHRASATTAVVYAFVGGLADSAFVNWFRSGRVAGLIPTNDGLANVWVCVSPDEFQRTGRGDLAGFLARGLRRTAPQLAAEVLDGRPVTGLRAFPGHLGATHQAHGPGWALVGDACSTEDPVSAHGMTKALVGAALLGEALGEIHLGADERESLTEYATRRSLLARSMLAPVIETARLDWAEEDLAGVHLRAGIGHRAEWGLLESLAAQPELVAASHAP